jgi:hypothetical protein
MKVHTRSVFVLSCFLAARAFAQDPPPKTDQTEASTVGNCAGRQDLAQHKILRHESAIHFGSFAGGSWMRLR